MQSDALDTARKFTIKYNMVTLGTPEVNFRCNKSYPLSHTTEMVGDPDVWQKVNSP